MAAATFDIKDIIGISPQNQTSRKFEHCIDIDTALIAAGVGIGAGESIEFYTTPVGCMIETVEAFLLTKADSANTIDIGDETDPDGWLDGGDVYVTAPAWVAKAGTEAYRAIAKSGKYYAAATGLRMTSIAADVALKVRVYVTGYMVNLD
jgi:hypothetical protein